MKKILAVVMVVMVVLFVGCGGSFVGSSSDFLSVQKMLKGKSKHIVHIMLNTTDLAYEVNTALLKQKVTFIYDKSFTSDEVRCDNLGFIFVNEEEKSGGKMSLYIDLVESNACTQNDFSKTAAKGSKNYVLIYKEK